LECSKEGGIFGGNEWSYTFGKVRFGKSRFRFTGIHENLKMGKKHGKTQIIRGSASPLKGQGTYFD